MVVIPLSFHFFSLGEYKMESSRTILVMPPEQHNFLHACLKEVQANFGAKRESATPAAKAIMNHCDKVNPDWMRCDLDKGVTFSKLEKAAGRWSDYCVLEYVHGAGYTNEMMSQHGFSPFPNISWCELAVISDMLMDHFHQALLCGVHAESYQPTPVDTVVF
jgi:hypothetical protein